MKKVHTSLLVLTTLLLVFFACSKSKITQEVKSIPFPEEIALNQCALAPDYGSKIICPQYRGPNNDHKIKPKNDPGPGLYYAWPEGLIIDPTTGEINVTQSETGAKYVIGFIPTAGNDTCLTDIIIGGVTYVDSVYVMAANDTLALPHFNANPLPTSVCDASDDTDYPGNGGNGGGNDKCEFDDGSDDDNGNGTADEPPPGQRANDQKVRVRTVSGIINLKKTLDEGAFGANPQNGDRKQVTIYYRLNDCSQKALQKVKVDLIYYEKKSDIPAQLLNETRAKRDNFMQARIIAPDGKPRPPQIFVTRIY